MIKAFGYLRTSSATNVGSDKDSETRQRVAIEACRDVEIVDWFYDAAVSGADPIEERQGFAEMLDRIDSNGVRTIVVEDVSRFARSMQAHVLGLALLRARDVTLLDASGTDLTNDTDEMQEAMISVAAVFAELEKKRLVKKLKAARDRKKAEGHKVEGRKSYAEMHPGAREAALRAFRKRKGRKETFA